MLNTSYVQNFLFLTFILLTGEQTLAQKKKRELELIERIANLECENTTNSKIIADLKSSLQLSEQNLVHMKEHFEKEVQIMNDKRYVHLWLN